MLSCLGPDELWLHCMNANIYAVHCALNAEPRNPLSVGVFRQDLTTTTCDINRPTTASCQPWGLGQKVVAVGFKVYGSRTCPTRCGQWPSSKWPTCHCWLQPRAQLRRGETKREGGREKETEGERAIHLRAGQGRPGKLSFPAF